jgi:UDP-glucuronate decarboxylase
MRRKRVLVTGGAGLIGSHLVDRLQADEVIVMDNFLTGSRENLWKSSKVELIRHDVCEPFHVEVDEIYHLACPASPVHYQRNPVRTIETCILGTSNALKCARDVGAKIFIASTSEIYGDPLEHPQKESYWGNVNPLGVRSCYDEGKRAAESLAMSYCAQYKVDVRIARIFNTYGARMRFDDGRVVSNFLYRALRGEPMMVYGDGKQTRSFCHVDDLVDGIIRYMRWGYLDTWSQHTLSHRVMNLGNPDEISMLELAKLIVTFLPEAKFEMLDASTPDDPRRRRPDITLASNLLDWQPKVALRTGLLDTLRDFRVRLFRLDTMPTGPVPKAPLLNS